MLAYCLEDGLTCNRHVYRRGDIFVLPIQMESEYGGLNPSQLASRQRQVYGKQMFSIPTGDEIIAAHNLGKVPFEALSKREQLLTIKQKSEAGLRMHEKAEVLKEKIYDEMPDLKDEEEEDATAIAPVESVQGITETPSLDPMKPKVSSTKKTTRKSSTKRKTTKE